MSNRIYDSSQLTKRRAEKAIAGSFLSRLYPPNGANGNPIRQPAQGSPPVLGDSNSSIMLAVKTGNMTEYTRFPTCYGISPGCPCPQLNASVINTPYTPSIPGQVTGITFTIGSIILNWNPATGDGPLIYKITPHLNGVAQTPVYTNNTSYRFTSLEEMKPYTFDICAINSGSSGPTTTSPTILAPPAGLTSVISGNPTPIDPEPSLKFILNTALDSMLNYIASVNLGPTRGSRYIYIWITSVVGAWNWVRPNSESRINGEHDEWNWSTNKAANPLNHNDSLIWLCNVIDYITPFFIPSGYSSPYNCPADVVARVKTDGEWSNWQTAWQTWYNYRQADGFTTATTTQPTGSANWNQTLIVDGTTVNNISEFPEPQQWTRLTVEGRKQNYLTYSWDNVLSSCLTEGNETAIQASVAPATGTARDIEIDEVKDMAATLTDRQKIIAEFWAGGPGTVSPPLMFIWFWKEYMRVLSTISCPDMIFSLQDLAIHLFEGARVTWRLKAAHMEDRPIQEIRRRFTGQQLASWNGTVDGAQWIPYQEANFITPPFADFPSGHSHFSKAFALTMNKWFGENIIKTAISYDQQKLICPLFSTSQTTLYGDFTVPSGTSQIQTGVPALPITLSFETWEEMSDSAGISRLYGGIHAETANESSKNTAVQVDTFINSTWNISTTNNPPLSTTSPPPPAPVEPVPQSEPEQAPEQTPIEQAPVEPEPTPTPAPVEPESTPAPVEPESTPSPVEPEPIPVEPEPTPAPVEPESTPSPVEPEPVPSPVEPEPVPLPVEPVPSPVEPEPTPSVIPYSIHINYTGMIPSEEVQALINQSKQFLENVISQSHGLRLPEISLDHDMVVDLDIQPLADNVLASARPTYVNASTSPAKPLRQTVILNSNRFNESSLLAQVEFNSTVVAKLVPVMIHEMLHGLGIASLQTGYLTVGWDQFLDEGKTWYAGPNNDWNLSEAIKAYRELVGQQVFRIPVENSFGQGTAYSHWEEGVREGFVNERRMYNYGSGPVFHPALPEEIMTGVAGNKFYFTKLTAGALVDHGYEVNMNSSNIVPYPHELIQS